MRNQNSFDDGNDDGSREDNGDGRSREDNGDDVNRQHLEELEHLLDALGDSDFLEGSEQLYLDEVIANDAGLRNFVEQQGGNVDFIPSEDVPGRLAEEEEALASRVEAVADYFHQRMNIAEVNETEEEEALARVQAVVYYFLHVQRITVAELIAILEQGMRSGIAPNPNTPLETKVHTDQKKKNRPKNLKYNKKKKREPSEEAQEVCHSAVCFDSHPYSVSQFVDFSSRRISWLKQPSAGRATMVEAETEEAPPWPLDPERKRQTWMEQTGRIGIIT
jgi:hypothetical protein